MPDQSAQTSITGFWTTVARHYEAHPGNTVPVESEAHQQWVEVFERALPAPPARVLDVGTGTAFAALISAGLGHRVTGIDLAPGMLSVARNMAMERSVDVRLVEGDAVAPPFHELSFDAITCRHVLWTLRDAETALRNWHRLLRPDGRVAVFDSFRPRQMPNAEPDEDDIFGRHYTPAVQAAIPFMHVNDAAPLIDAFMRSGFSDVTIHDLPQELADDDDDAVRPYVLTARRCST